MSAEKNSSQSRKRSRRSCENENDSQDDYDESNYESGNASTSSATNNIDPKLFNVTFPREYEVAFATAIFELGLKHSSPKVLIPLMPRGVPLSTEHIKSHLQKYRIHRPRSKEEFQAFYDNNIKDSFRSWDNRQGWETTIAGNLKGGIFSRSSQSFRSIAIDSSKTRSDSDHSSEAGNKQEQLRQRLKQLHELQMALLASSSLLSEWSTMGKEVLERNAGMRQEIKGALASFEEQQHFRLQQQTNSSSSDPNGSGIPI